MKYNLEHRPGSLILYATLAWELMSAPSLTNYRFQMEVSPLTQ